MLKMMTARIGSMTLCVTFSSLAISGLAAQEQSVLQRTQAETQLNSPTNSLLEAAGSRPTAQGDRQSQEDMDLLTKGPLHEAFAEVQLDSPTPNPVIARQPPEAIKELPPKYQPEGENVEWIPGYWAWDDDRENYLWISGIWRDIPPGQRWVPGYWETVEGGFRWVNGFWMDDEVEEIEYLPAPPESLDNGPSTPAPSAAHFYAPGNWVYQENDYVWQPGCWMPRVENWVWVPPTYVWTPRGAVFRGGYWDRLFDCRGVVFAPVFYNRPIYSDFDYFYTPSCVINTNFDLLPHLFLRRNCRSYYFGDWYDNRYLGGGGFCAWSQIGLNPGFGRCYDPFFVYYSHSSIRYNNLGVISWARNQHDYCFQNIAYRPPALFNVNVNIINQRTVINGQPVPQPVVIADTLERRVRTTARKADGREAFRQLAEEERRDFQKRTEPIETIARERRAAERRAERELARGQAELDPAINPGGETAGERPRPDRLALPKVERQQQLAAERAAAELKRQQEKDERTARTEERRSAAEAANAARRAARNQEKFAEDAPPVLKQSEGSGEVAGAEELPRPGAANRPRSNRGGTASRGSQADANGGAAPGSDLAGGVETQPGKLTPDQRRQANEARQQAQREAAAQRDAARDLARQQEAAARDLERQQRASRNGGTVVGGAQPPLGGPVDGQPRGASRDFDRAARAAAEQQQRQQRELQMQQRRASEQAARQAGDQQRAQREMEMQQRRAAEQAARQAADQQRSAEMAMRRQQEAQERANRQQQEMQQRQARQQQDQMRQQQQQARESAARQQRDMERQQREMQRQQQQQERRRGGGGGGNG